VDARRRFEELIAHSDSEIPLAETALWISAEARPYVDVAHWLGEIDGLAGSVTPQISSAGSDQKKVEILNHFLFDQEGFSGNQTDYTNPKNSFLDEVLESRKGIPITLSILYLEVAKRVGVHSVGVGFPGHFLVKVITQDEDIMIDPFFGRILNTQECETLLRQVAGQEAVFTQEMLDPTPHSEILQRVLRNLKLVYLREKKLENALSCSDRIVLLAGSDLSELRDRGLLYRELECAGPALSDLERYLAFSPENPDKDTLTGIIEELRRRVQQIN